MLTLNVLPTKKSLELNILPTNITTQPTIITKKQVARTRYNLITFLKRASEVHGDRFDYSLIKPEHIINNTSKVPIICHKHGEPFIWYPSINGHLKPGQKLGCPQCSGRFKYTLEIFLQRAHIVHNNRYDYSMIKEGDIKGASSKVPIICHEHITPHIFHQAISNHISTKQGCPSCGGKFSYTLELFLEKAKAANNNRYSYELVTNQHITGAHAKVPVICYAHEIPYKWDVKITVHINGGHGCAMCSGNTKYNLEYFLIRANEIHGKNYDYSMIKEENIQGKDSHIPIKCLQCQNIWNPTIHGHIFSRYGCPFCACRIPWSLSKFKIEAVKIHGDLYDYSLIKEEDITGEKCKVYIKCKKFGHTFLQTVDSHIYKGSGCKHCSNSKGYSQMQIDWIEGLMKQHNINIQYALSPEGEHKILGVGKVDGYHEESNTVLEFHGDFFHGNPRLYKPEDMNQKLGKTYGELYQRTLEREQKIRNLGYNLIVTWELDYKASLKSK